MIDIKEETLVPCSKVSDWCEKHIGTRVKRSTVHRWRVRGCRGVKLEPLLVGGRRRYTSEEALERFFHTSTSAADGGDGTMPTPRINEAAHRKAMAYLKAEGI
jgi:hypothetical protein